MTGISGTKQYPLSCPTHLWEDWNDAFADDDLNVNEALIVTLASETLRKAGDDLTDEQRAEYEELIDPYE